MKRLLLFVIAIALGWGLKAQCPLNTAVDFTATDVHGTQIHLFDILDQGQYVLIDFFFTTCGPCQQVTPKIVQSYYTMGCNMHDVYYMEIASGDSEAACINWVNNYGVEYPTISGVAGGTGICNSYHIDAYPTVILVAPDRSIVIKDLYPIPNAQTVVSALESHGVEQHECGSSPEVTISIDLVTETEVTATFTPNEDCASYAYTMATENEIQQWMNIAGLELPEYLWTYGIPGTGTITNTFNGLTPETEYNIYAVPADIDGNLGEVVHETVVTTIEGEDEIMPDFTGTDINGNEIHLYDILDAGQAVLIYFFHSDYDPCISTLRYVSEAFTFFGCNQHDVFFMEISSYDHNDACQTWTETYNVNFPTISRDGGGNTIAQSIPVAFYPTVMIIRPNHTIAVRDLYPVESTQSIIDALENESYEHYPCYEGTLTFSMDSIELPYIGVTEITVYNNTSEDAVIHSIKETNSWDDFCLISFLINGIDYEQCPDNLEITLPQGDSLSLFMSCDMVGKIDPDYIEDLVTISSNLPDASFTVMVEHSWSADENGDLTTLFPNPANERVILKGQNLDTVRIFNALGQKVDEFEAHGNEFRINTTNYSSGVYFVKANETTFRFVVTH